MATQLHISATSVSRIFHFWIKLLYRKFKVFNTNATMSQLERVMPQDVKNSSLNRREIFDATEMYTQKPSDPIAQKLMVQL